MASSPASKSVAPSQFLANTDMRKPHHKAFYQAALERLIALEPAALDRDGELYGIWAAAAADKEPLVPQDAPGAPATGQNSWEGVMAIAKEAGARWPELVAAQWGLESGFGKHVSGTHNYFGLKGGGSNRETPEYIDGKWITIRDNFINFPDISTCVEYLVERWYKDYRGYKGVNNSSSRSEAARQLVLQGYATDPTYSDKLIKIMNERCPVASSSAPTPDQRKEWVTSIKVLNLSQPDASTCQSACIAMAVGDKNIAGIRKKLLAAGDAGDPALMKKVITSYGKPYMYDGDACLEDVYSWLRAGEFLITHGWFTKSGHVICLDGLRAIPKSSRSELNVKDPWSEFNAPTWKYDKTSKFYDGFYSEACIYAACVAGTSAANAYQVYKAGTVDMKRGGMWVHRFLVS